MSEPAKPSMHHREITLADGRYLIFYTFENAGTGVTSDNRDAASGAAEPADKAGSDSSVEINKNV